MQTKTLVEIKSKVNFNQYTDLEMQMEIREFDSLIQWNWTNFHHQIIIDTIKLHITSNIGLEEFIVYNHVDIFTLLKKKKKSW